MFPTNYLLKNHMSKQNLALKSDQENQTKPSQNCLGKSAGIV